MQIIKFHRDNQTKNRKNLACDCSDNIQFQWLINNKRILQHNNNFIRAYNAHSHIVPHTYITYNLNAVRTRVRVCIYASDNVRINKNKIKMYNCQ